MAFELACSLSRHSPVPSRRLARFEFFCERQGTIVWILSFQSAAPLESDAVNYLPDHLHSWFRYDPECFVATLYGG